MLDIETLSTKHNATILTLGAVKFNPYTDVISSEMYLKPNVDEQIELGRHVDEETIEWWGNQNKDVQDDAFGLDGRLSVEEFLNSLNKFLVGVDKIWAHGTTFDLIIIDNLYKQLGKPTPWVFWNIRDSRTLFGVHGDPRDKTSQGRHNALQDSISQAKGVQQIYNQLGLKSQF